MRAHSSKSTIYLVISGILWGTGGLIGTVLGQLTGLSPLAVAAYRLLVGGLLIVGYLVLAGRRRSSGQRGLTRRRRPSGRGAWTRIAVVGLLSAQFQSCYFLAISQTSVSLATLITIGAAPVIVQVADAFRGRGSGRGKVLTTMLALLGLALLVGVPGAGFSEGAMVASAALSLLAAAGFAAVTMIGTRPVPGLDDLTVTGYAFLLGGLPLLLAAALVGRVGCTLDPATVGLVAALGTGPTAVAYLAYFRGLRGAPAYTGTLVTLLEPLTSAVLAVLILGDRLSAAGIAGAVILGLAVIGALRH